MPDLRGLLYIVVVVLVVLAGLLLGLDNAEPVALRLFEFSSPALPLVLWVLAALLLGLMLGYALATGLGLRRRLALRRLERALADARAEIEDLRVLAGQARTEAAALEEAPAARSAQDPAPAS